MTVIARAYESEQKANEAISALIDNGVTEDRIQIVRPASEQSTVSDGLRAGKALAQFSNTESYAKALEKGQTVVITEAHFGKGMALSNAMDACNPVPLEVTADSEPAYDYSTPFSYMLGISVLSRNNPTPFSDMFGFSTKSKGLSSLRRWFGGTISDSATPISNMMSMPTLTSKNSTFFSRFGFRDLSEEKHFTSSFGLPLLIDEATPLSSKVGMGSQSSEAAPLSRMFGLKVLTTERDKTPAPPADPTN